MMLPVKVTGSSSSQSPHAAVAVPVTLDIIKAVQPPLVLTACKFRECAARKGNVYLLPLYALRHSFHPTAG